MSQGRREQFLWAVFSCDLIAATVSQTPLSTFVVTHSISVCDNNNITVAHGNTRNQCNLLCFKCQVFCSQFFSSNTLVEEGASQCVCVCVLPAVYSNGMVARLLLLLLHCSDYVDHAFTVSGDAHLWPAVEMELTHRSGLVLLGR